MSQLPDQTHRVVSKLLGFGLAICFTSTFPTTEALAASDSYWVFAQPKEYPDDGPRTVEADPAGLGGSASPFGWHDTDGVDGAEYTITRGNNAHAYVDLDGDDLPDIDGSPDGGSNLEFLFPLDLTDEPELYRPAAVTNAFYWANTVHDVLYGYGFDESSGNFQENSYGRGGAAGDPFLVEVQEGSFTNGATIQVYPDGQSPRMELGVFSATSPKRDSALSSFVNVFLYGQAVSRRLVGGPDDVDCLSPVESTGLLIGWADYLALVLTADFSESATTSRGVGTYILGQDPSGSGIRVAPYSTDGAINALTYGSIPSLSVPFGTGAVWATMLWQLYWELVDAHGFNPDVRGHWSTGGNNLSLQLVLDGMKQVGCDPGFVDARDAILDADELLTGGENHCAIWRAFADRGLGFSATQGSPGSIGDGVEAFDLPPGCSSSDIGSTDPVASAGDGLRLELANPLDGEASIRYFLPVASRVRVAVYDLHGREVVSLLEGARSAGEHVAQWTGRARDGRMVAAGVFFVRLESSFGSITRKITVSR